LNLSVVRGTRALPNCVNACAAYSVKMTVHWSTYSEKDWNYYWKHTGSWEVRLAENSFIFCIYLDVYQKHTNTLEAVVQTQAMVLQQWVTGRSCFLIQGESGISWSQLVSQDREHFSFIFFPCW